MIYANKDSAILLCNPDEELLKFLHILSKAITHCKGSDNIFNKLKKQSNRFALIDEDPNAVLHPYYSELTLANQAKGVKVFIDSTRQNKVVVLMPRFEEWLIQTAKETKIKLSDFNMSDNPHYLHSSINGRLNSLKKLLATINKNQTPRFEELKKHFTQ